MQQLVLKKTPMGNYRVVEFKGIPLDALGDFLISDVTDQWYFDPLPGFEDNSFLSWLGDAHSKIKAVGGNVMMMERIGDKIYVDSQYRKNWRDWSEAFVGTAECLIAVLKQWYDILEKDPLPDEVHLMQEGERVLVIPQWKCTEVDSVLPAVAVSN